MSTVISISNIVEMPENPTRNFQREYERKYYEQNKEHIRARKREYYQKNKEKELKRAAKYRGENPEKVRKTNKKWTENNREKRAKTIREYINTRERIDPQFKLLRSLRSRLRTAINKKTKNSSMLDLLGCSIDELRSYLENLWLPGMNWENWSFRGWHIDHIKPLSSFDLTDDEQLKQACHYTNLQPLWWRDNLVKGNDTAKGS